MSCNYAEGLSSYENKGILGLPEVINSLKMVNVQIAITTLFSEI